MKELLMSTKLFQLKNVGIIAEYLPMDAAQRLIDQIEEQLQEWKESARAYQIFLTPHVDSGEINVSSSQKSWLSVCLNQIKRLLERVKDNKDNKEDIGEFSTLDQIENALYYHWGDVGQCLDISQKTYSYYNFLDYVAARLTYYRGLKGKASVPYDENLRPYLEARNIFLACADLFSLKPYTINIALVQLMEKQLHDKGVHVVQVSDTKNVSLLERKLAFNGEDKGLSEPAFQGIAVQWLTLHGLIKKPRSICTDLTSKGYQVLLDEKQKEQLEKLCPQTPTIRSDENMSFGFTS